MTATCFIRLAGSFRRLRKTPVFSLQSNGKLRLLDCREGLGEPGRNRTCDPLIKSQLLYRLSYRLSQERRNLVFDSGWVNVGKAAPSDFRGMISKRPKRSLE